MKKIFRLEGLDCANCAAKMEKAIKKIDGVNDVTVNFLTEKMIIDCQESKFTEINEKLGGIIRRIEPDVVLKKA